MKRIYKEQISIVIIILIATILLCLLVVFSVAYLNVKNDLGGVIAVGDISIFVERENEDQTSIVPGADISQNVTVFNARKRDDFDKLCPVLLRFDINVLVDGILDDTLYQYITPIFANMSDFTQDGKLYYYNDVLSPGESVNICKSLHFDNQIGNVYQGKSVQVNFVVDAIQSQNGAYLEEWSDAPKNWQQLIAKKV